MDDTTPTPTAPATTAKGEPKKKTGRPPKFDADLAAKVVEGVRAGNFLETACNLAGLNVKTARVWLYEGNSNPRSRYADFAKAVSKARADAEAADLAEMERRAKNANDGAGDWKERAWRLERRDPRKWGPKLLVEFRNMLGEFLDHLERHLDDETFEKVCAAAAGFDGEESSSEVDGE